FLLDFSSSAIFTAVASLFFWQWELSSLAVGTSSSSGNFITGSGKALCILFPTQESVEGLGIKIAETDEVPTNMAHMAFSDSKPQFKSYEPKSSEIESKNANEDTLNELKEYPDAPLVKDMMSDNKDCLVKSYVVVEKKTDVPTIAKVKVVRPKQQEKLVRKTIKLRSVNTARPRPINTVRPRTVNTARPNSAVINAVIVNQVNAVKASACKLTTAIDVNAVEEDGVKFLMFPRFVQVLLDSQVEGMLKHKEIYVITTYTKKIFANMKRQGKYFSGKVTPLFKTIMVQTQEYIAEDLERPTDSHHTSTITQLSTSSQPQQKKKSKKSKKRITEVPQLSDSNHNVADEHLTTNSNDPLLSGSSTRVESSEDVVLGDLVDASKQGRMIDDLDADEGVTLVEETQERNDQDMFYTSILDGEEVVAEKEVSTADLIPTTSEVVTTTGEVVTTAGVETSKPKAKGIVMQEPSETPTPTPIDSSKQPSKAKDKGKAKMI
nr:hypothetical protein [Tanacetum cinerariifolium]